MARLIQSVLQGFPCLFTHLHTHKPSHNAGSKLPSLTTGRNAAVQGLSRTLSHVCRRRWRLNRQLWLSPLWHFTPLDDLKYQLWWGDTGSMTLDATLVTLRESHRFQLSRYSGYFTALSLVILQHSVVQCASFFGKSSCFICTFIFKYCFICDSNTKLLTHFIYHKPEPYFFYI